MRRSVILPVARPAAGRRTPSLFTRAAVAAALLAACLTAACRRSTAPPPHVVLLVLDTVRADAIGARRNGRSITPHVDALAREGLNCVNAYTPAPWTLPAHASLFTGLYPHQHMAVHDRYRLDSRFTTLAEMLRAHGYRTVGFTCNPWVHRKGGMAQGFDRYEEVFRLVAPGGDQGAATATAMVAKWIRQYDDDKPFFLFVNYVEAHLPFHPPTNVLARLGWRPPYPFDGSFPIERGDQHIIGLAPLSAGERDDLTALYHAEVAYVDDQVGAVRAALHGAGLLRHTVLVVVSDHGEHLGEHGLTGHQFSLYDELLRVPLIVRLPEGLCEPGPVTAPASLLDVLPTVLDVVGLPVDDRMGRSLLRIPREASQEAPPVLLAEYARPRILIQNYWTPRFPGINMAPFDTGLKAVRDGELKYVTSDRGVEWLFDLHSDPQEEKNRAETFPDRLMAMRGVLDAELSRR